MLSLILYKTLSKCLKFLKNIMNFLNNIDLFTKNQIYKSKYKLKY